MRRRNVAALAVAAGLLVGLTLDPPAIEAADEVGLLTNLAQEPQLVQFQERAKGDGALGFYVDGTTASLVVVVPRAQRGKFDIASLGAPAVSMSIKWSDVDASALAAARTHLQDVLEDPEFRQESMATHFDARKERIHVTTTIKADVLEKVLGSDWSLIDYEFGQVELLAGRTDDFAPFAGGARVEVVSNGDICTTGFTAIKGTTRAMVLPGHCGNQQSNVVTIGGTSIGTTGTDGPFCGPSSVGGSNSDFQFVRGKGYTDDIWVGSIPGSRADVTEWGSAGVGVAYRYSGSSTFESGPFYVVSDTDGSLWLEDYNLYPCRGVSEWNLLHLIVSDRNGHCDAIEGDSGAPFFIKKTANPYTVGLRGMVVARTPSNCYAIKLSTIKNLTGYAPLTTN